MHAIPSSHIIILKPTAMHPTSSSTECDITRVFRPRFGIGLDALFRHDHLLVRGVALLAALRLPVGGLLVLLHETAAAAAAGHRDIDDAVALQVVLLAHVVALEGREQGGQTEACGAAEEKALRVYSR
jgi:hypothetical protein